MDRKRENTGAGIEGIVKITFAPLNPSRPSFHFGIVKEK